VEISSGSLDEASKWIKRASAELARSRGSFGPTPSHRDAEEISKLAMDISKAELRFEMASERHSSSSSSGERSEVERDESSSASSDNPQDEEVQESVVKYEHEDYAPPPKVGAGFLAQELADFQIMIVSWMTNYEHREGLEYFVKQIGFYAENDKLLFANGHSGFGVRRQLHRDWALGLREMCATYSMAEFMQGRPAMQFTDGYSRALPLRTRAPFLTVTVG
jgi:hypothetical protein